LSEFWRVYSRLQRRNALFSGAFPLLLQDDMVGWELILLGRVILVQL
jgi:hypothetical protein